MGINLKPVESSNISAMDYKDEQNVLHVQFHAMPELIYSFLSLPPNVAKAFIASPSKGAFFMKNIKNKYRFVKTPLDKLSKEPEDKKPLDTPKFTANDT